jgi:uncharacterized repeat protein (TIGR03803 family)
VRPSKLAESYRIAILFIVPILLACATAPAQSSEHVVYAFSSGCGDPVSPLVKDAAGNFYGTTPSGGANGYGCVFEISRAVGGWKYSVLYNFSGADGEQPWGALAFDQVGNLYGTARGGGAYGVGVAFELSVTADGSWTETVLHSFGNGDDGSGPQSEITFDDAGNLYGTTVGSGGDRRGGTVYKLIPGVGGWTETVLYAFPASIAGPDGDSPAGGVVMDRKGRLYGNTAHGGAYGDGAVYELAPSGEGYQETIIHSFDVYDGLEPSSSLVMDSHGTLYGTSTAGGSSPACPYVGCGTVFELARDTHGKWNERILHEMTGSDGDSTVGPVAFDSAGNLYAAAQFGGINGMGSVFELTPTRTGPWKETVLHLFDYQFPNGKDGESPYAGVIFNQGKVFGTTASGGGSYNSGTVFEITPTNGPADTQTGEAATN